MKKKLQKDSLLKQTFTQTSRIVASVGHATSKKLQEPVKRKTAKKAFFFLLLLSIGRCQTEPNNKQPPPASATPTLVVQVLDLSESATLKYFDTAAASSLYNAVANNGGGTIKLICVTENSLQQNVYTADIPPLNLTATDNIKNVYQLAKVKAKNQRATSQYETQAQVAIQEYAHQVSRPHDKRFTDLENSFSLATTCLAQRNYDGHTKYLLVCSDMINDPPYKRHAALTPVHLPNTTVLIVRPSLSPDSLKVIFPQSEVLVFTSIHDAISILNNHKN